MGESCRPGSILQTALRPYAERFAMAKPILLRQCALSAMGSATWDASLGPALAALSGESFGGNQLSPADLRAALIGDCTDVGSLDVNTELFEALLRTAGVPWAGEVAL